MPIYRSNNGTLKQLKADLFKKEHELQKLIEQNLPEIFEMHFLASEYSTTSGGRIDTLAIDYNGAPVIIEYKLNQNENIINQGLSYLKWLKAQKVEFFEKLVEKKLGEKAKKINVDWKNPRVICIAENYGKFDIDTVEVITIRMELYKYRYYENGFLSIEPLNNVRAKEDNEIKEKNKQINISIEEHIKKATPFIQDLFQSLREKILMIDENIEEKATSIYIAYKVSKNFAELHINKNQLVLYLRPVEYEDNSLLVEKIPDSYAWSLNRRIYIKTLDDLEKSISFIERSYTDIL
jgi:predicted transport protein